MRRLPLAPWAAALAALVLFVASPLQYRRERAARELAQGRWETTGAAASHPTAASRARRDPDPADSGVALARVLWNDAFEARTIAALPRAEAAAEGRRAEARLTLAEQLGRAGLARRPSSWDSAMLIGAARLLADWRRHGDDLYAHPEAWRTPLRYAASLAPGSPEPRRLLVAGYLSSWHALSTAERDAGHQLLRAAFADPDTLGALLPAWAAVAASREELESVLPVEPRPYDLLQQAAARRGDWQGYCAARQRWLPLTIAASKEQLVDAERRFAGGDEQGGRSDLLGVTASAPPDERAAALFTQAIEQLPAGPVGATQATALSGWLSWALPLWQLDKASLPPEVLARLASLSPDLPPAQAALAAVAAGDLERAGVWERRAERLWSEEWAPYATAKAEALLDRGHPDEAAEVLGQVHRSYRDRWPYLRARQRLAQARRDVGVPSPDSLAATRWGGEQWLYQGGAAALEVVAAQPATALGVTVDTAPPEGAAVDLAWDGLGAGCFPVKAGALLRLPVAVSAGPHRLVWRPLAGGRTAPGTVELVLAGGAGSG